VLPDYCVLGANSLLNDAFHETLRLYAGVPAKPVAVLDASMKYFSHPEGYVV
jgi:hypothetical protein